MGGGWGLEPVRHNPIVKFGRALEIDAVGTGLSRPFHLSIHGCLSVSGTPQACTVSPHPGGDGYRASEVNGPIRAGRR